MGCGGSSPQRELLRVVRTGAGDLRFDRARCSGGRGGYLHRRSDCWAAFAKRKGALRSFRAAVDRPARAALIAELQLNAVE